MKRLLTAALSLGLFLSPVAGAAQNAPIPGPQEYLDFMGAGDAVVATWGGVYIGPYAARFAGSGGSPTSPQFSVYCVDYTHYASDQWVNSTSLSQPPQPGNMGLTRLGDGSFSTYRASAYYSSLFDSWTTLGSDKRTVWSALHAAVWYQMSGGDVNLGSGATLALRDQLLGINGNSDTYSSQAASFNADGWYVISPGDGYNGQEFLVRTEVPEPSAYLLLATGLLLLVASGRRRSKELAEQA